MKSIDAVSIGVQAGSKLLHIKEQNIYFDKSIDFSNTICLLSIIRPPIKSYSMSIELHK